VDDFVNSNIDYSLKEMKSEQWLSESLNLLTQK